MATAVKKFSTYVDLSDEQKTELRKLTKRLVYPAMPDYAPVDTPTNPVLDSIPYHIIWMAVATEFATMLAQATPDGMWRAWKIRGFTLCKDTFDNGESWHWVIDVHGQQHDEDPDSSYVWEVSK